MSYGYWESDQRYRRRFFAGAVRMAIYLAVLLGVAALGYQIGLDDNKAEDDGLRAQVARLRAEAQAAVDARIEAEGVALRARADAQRWQQRFEAEVPDGPPRELLAQIQKRLAEGLPAERLAVAIAAAGPPHDCTPPEAKRFMVKTPITPDSAPLAITLGGGALVVTATGPSERTADGRPEAWFDPAQPITLKMTPLGGAGAGEVSGVLPLHTSFVAGGLEHRLSVTAANRGFVQVAAERCKLP